MTPRARREAIEGRGGRLLLRLSAPPVDGAANAAMVTMLARAFGVGRSAIRIQSGEAARDKRVFVAGAPLALAQVARRLYGAGHDG